MFNERPRPGLLQIISLNRTEQAEYGDSMREPSVERAVGHARYDGTVQSAEGAYANSHIDSKACDTTRACV